MSNVSVSAGPSADVVIVGGGVIGLSIARELASRGVRHVTVIECGEFGKEASWAAGGILAPQVEANRADAFFGLACASRDLYPVFARTLQAETGIDIQFDQTGTIYVGFTEEEEHELCRRFEWQTKAGFRVEWLSGEDARSVEPVISPDVRCALLFPDDWQVENRMLTQALVASNEQLGVQLIGNCAARTIQISDAHVTGIDALNGFIDASTIVIAAGAWTSGIGGSSSHFVGLQIEPVRGQMLCFKTNARFPRHVIYSSRGYLVPRHDGRLLAGSTSEHVGFDKQVTEEGTESIRSMAFEIAPSLQSAEISDSWAGFRPHAADDLPVLGEAEGIRGLFYATGHYRNGILLAPITAKLMADSIADGATSEWPEVFSPNRFRLAVAGA